MAFWMRRLGTGTGFACAKLSEVLPRSERSLATVRMTDWASVDRFGRDDGSGELVRIGEDYGFWGLVMGLGVVGLGSVLSLGPILNLSTGRRRCDDGGTVGLVLLRRLRLGGS